MGRFCPARWVMFMAERGDYMGILSCCVNLEGLCEVRLASLVRITGSNSTYLAFGDWTDGGEGPTVWFDGGSDFTACFKNAPVIHYDVLGQCRIKCSGWMDQYNCPNLFNKEYVAAVTYFVQSNLPILYLLHNRCLDKEDVVKYFSGAITWSELLRSVHSIPEDAYPGLLSCENCAQLHLFCVSKQIYGKEVLDDSQNTLLCSPLKRQLRPEFELGEWDGEVVLEGYHANKENVVIPAGVCIINAGVFEGHKEIKRIVFPDTLREIRGRAFFGCTGLEILDIPKSVEVVAELSFGNCTALQYICFEKSDRGEPWLILDDNAFLGCACLREVRMPDYAEMWENPFAYCPSLCVIEFFSDAEKPKLNAPVNGDIWQDRLRIGCNGTHIPGWVQEIGSRAFVGCDGLTELYVPDSVKDIAPDSFVDCPNLSFQCHLGSYAERFARENGIPVFCID